VSSNFPEQRGATRIVALVVVLLVVLLATRISSTYLVLFRSVENHTALQQARAWLRGAESVAKEALLRDLQLDSSIDSTLELWAQPLQLPLPEGVLSACLLDLQGRVNLNDLAAPAAAVYSPAQKRFIRLLQALDMDEPPDSVAAIALANAVFDWLDTDDDRRYPGGAEELEYLQLPLPYRPANQAFVSITELNLISGITPALVAALMPHVSVWGNGNLNLNTLDHHLLWSARAEAGISAAEATPLMLRILNNAASLLPLRSEAAALLAAARSANGGVLQNLELFRSGPLAAQNWELDGLALTSDFFLLTADMQVQARHYQLQSVLQRAVTPAGVPVVTVRTRQYGSALFNLDDHCAAALP
jgi:general secretion pathway protein K